MKDVHSIIADVEANWVGATNEQREDLVKKLKKAEGSLDESDAETRTHIGNLIDKIERARHEHQQNAFVVPPLGQGAGFGFGGIPVKLDRPE